MNIHFTAAGSAPQIKKLLEGSDVPVALREMILERMKDKEETHDFAVSLNVQTFGLNSTAALNVSASLKVLVSESLSESLKVLEQS